MIAAGSPEAFLSPLEVDAVVDAALTAWRLDGARVLVLVPDATRTAPLAAMFRRLHTRLKDHVQALDFLVALGTHPPLDEPGLLRLFGINAAERADPFHQTGLFNHHWDQPEALVELGCIPAAEVRVLSGGLLDLDIPVRVNRRVLDYDVLLVCGPVFPHEVAGFSGGSKYFFPGISGPEVIHTTHWLGALCTSYATIGVKETPVRAVIERAAGLIPRRRLALNMVVQPEGMRGLFAGDVQASWSAAADLSAQVHVRYVEQPFHQVLSLIPPIYDDLWTGAKGMYKLEPVVADGGEIILYAPHIHEISYTHGRLLDEVGYHVRDYFTAQWERFRGYPWGVLAHSTHLRGMGSYRDGIETARIRVTLASQVSEERCRRLNLGYRDPAEIRPQDWAGREREGLLLVPRAGEVLYRLRAAKART